MDFNSLDTDETDEMARGRADEGLVKELAGKLSATGLDRDRFDAAYAELSADKRLKAAEIIAIAQSYAKGRKPRSKSDAMTAIRKRFVELRQIETLSRNAEKARPW